MEHQNPPPPTPPSRRPLGYGSALDQHCDGRLHLSRLSAPADPPRPAQCCLFGPDPSGQDADKSDRAIKMTERIIITGTAASPLPISRPPPPLLLAPQRAATRRTQLAQPFRNDRKARQCTARCRPGRPLPKGRYHSRVISNLLARECRSRRRGGAEARAFFGQQAHNKPPFQNDKSRTSRSQFGSLGWPCELRALELPAGIAGTLAVLTEILCGAIKTRQ